MAVTSITKNFTTQISAMLDANLPGVYDEVFQISPTLTYWYGKTPLSGSAPNTSKVRKQYTGGDKIMINVEYAMSNGLKRMTNRADTVTIAPSEIVTRAYYDLAWYAIPAPVFDLDMRKIRGKAALFDWVMTLKNNVAKTLAYNLASDLFKSGPCTDANSVGAINGLMQLIAPTGTYSAAAGAATTVGGIDPTTTTTLADGTSVAWWKNQYALHPSDGTTAGVGSWYVAAATGPNKSYILRSLDQLLVKCVKGGMGVPPDLGIANEMGFLYLGQALINRGYPTLADETDLKYGIRSITYGASKVIYDPFMPNDAYSATQNTTPTTGDIMFVNSNGIYPVVDPTCNLTWSGPERSPNQFCDVWKLQWFGNIVAASRRGSGAAPGITVAT